MKRRIPGKGMDPFPGERLSQDEGQTTEVHMKKNRWFLRLLALLVLVYLQRLLLSLITRQKRKRHFARQHVLL